MFATQPPLSSFCLSLFDISIPGPSSKTVIALGTDDLDSPRCDPGLDTDAGRGDILRVGHSIILFHSAYGLRPGVLRFADELRAAGHEVTTPDLYDGEVFASLEEGLRKRDSLGRQELARRAVAAAADTPSATVFAGFSLGAAMAFVVATRTPKACGLLLMHGALDPSAFDVPAWPARLAVTVHHAKNDPWVDEADVDALEAEVRQAGAPFESFTYPCTGHLFADEDLPDYDAPSAELMKDRIAAFLVGLR